MFACICNCQRVHIVCSTRSVFTLGPPGGGSGIGMGIVFSVLRVFIPVGDTMVNVHKYTSINRRASVFLVSMTDPLASFD